MYTQQTIILNLDFEGSMCIPSGYEISIKMH